MTYSHINYSKKNDILICQIKDKKTSHNGLIVDNATILGTFLTKKKPKVGDFFDTYLIKDQQFIIVEILETKDAKGIVFEGEETDLSKSYRERYDLAIKRIEENGNLEIFKNASILFRIAKT